MAMMIQLLSSRGFRIVTIEDPIEYRFPNTAASVITQREVGRDVSSFAEGLKYAMRQDPDIILVGEIRDQETARMALRHRRDRPSRSDHVTHARCEGCGHTIG